MDDEDNDKPTFVKFCGYHWRGVVTFIVPLLFSPLPILNEGSEFRCMYVLLVCCCFWITECIPLFVTSMIPLFALPLLGILDSELVAEQYFKDTVVMFIGGIIMSLGVEYSNLHKRIALKTILIVGCSPRRLHFGLVVVTSFVSLWISNSAAAAMMCPIIKAIIEELHNNDILEVYMDESIEPMVDGKKHPSHIAMGFYFGGAYAATVGGCGTLIDATDEIDFPRYMAWAMPMTIVNTFLLFLILQITHFGLFRPNSKEGMEVAKGTLHAHTVRAVVIEKVHELGPISVHEWQVLFCFIAMIVLLFFRSPGFMAGWKHILNVVQIGPSCAMMFCVIALVVFPMTCSFCKHCKPKDKQGK